MSPERMENVLRSRANVTRACLERVSQMSDAQLEALRAEYTRAQSRQRGYDSLLRRAERDAQARSERPGVADRAPILPPTGPRPELPACGYEAQLEQGERRTQSQNMQMRLAATGFYALLGSAVGYVAGREALGRGREGAAAGAAVAAVVGFIAAKDVRRGGWGMW